MSYFSTLFTLSELTDEDKTEEAIAEFSARRSSSVHLDTMKLLAALNEEEPGTFKKVFAELETYYQHIWGLDTDEGLTDTDTVLLDDLFSRPYLSATQRTALTTNLRLLYYKHNNDQDKASALILESLQAGKIAQSNLAILEHAYGYTLCRWGDKTLLALINRGQNTDEDSDSDISEAPNTPHLRIYEFDREDEAILIEQILALKTQTTPYQYIEDVILSGGLLLAAQMMTPQDTKENCSVIATRHLERLLQALSSLPAASPDTSEARSIVITEALHAHYSDKTHAHRLRYETLLIPQLLLAFKAKTLENFLDLTCQFQELLRKSRKSRDYHFYDSTIREPNWDGAFSDLHASMIRFALAVSDSGDRLTALKICLQLSENSFELPCPAIVDALVQGLRLDDRLINTLKMQLIDGHFPLNENRIAAHLFESQTTLKTAQSFSGLWQFCRESELLMAKFQDYLSKAIEDPEILWAKTINYDNLTVLIRFTAPGDRVALYKNLLLAAESANGFIIGLLEDRERLNGKRPNKHTLFLRSEL